jgi:hypothetical protein
MKNLSSIKAFLALTAFACAPLLIHAQDAPPPPPDQGQPPPDQGAPPPDQGDGSDDQGASFQQFYDQLGSQGQWIQTDNYGYVFQPTVSDPDWAPYTDGHWVYSDVGWTWASDESWGWATYHYGRWANIDGTGWVWVPGYRWAPAWVSWRYGGGYAGWAPLPPETFVGVEYGGNGGWASFHFGGDVDVNFGIGAGCYNFVNVGFLGDGNYHGHYLDRNQNYTVINHTTNVTNINVTNNYYGGAGGNFRNVNTGGPSLEEVNAHAHTHVQTVQLTAASQAGRSTLQGNSLAVYAPRVNAASVHAARPTQVSQTLAHPTFNRGTSITKPMQVNAQFKPAAPSAEAIASAKEARASAPKSANIATSSTQMKTHLSKPLTSMAPVPQTHTASAAAPAEKPTSPAASHPAESSFTGETQKPAPTYHPAAEAPATGGEVYHPQSQFKPTPTEGSSGQVYHPQTQNEGGQVYHPQTEEKPMEEKPAPSYHPEAQAPASSYHPQEAPAPTYHPQTEPQHEVQQVQHEAQAPASHPQPAPAKPAASSGSGNKEAPKNGTNQQQGH